MNTCKPRSGRGRLLLLAGPSGVGKGTLVRELIDRHPEIWISISATTRAPRAGEVSGVHYLFLDEAEFLASKEDGGFLEAFEVFGNWYGTPREPVVHRLDQGFDVLLEIDTVGALAVQDLAEDDEAISVRSVFVRAPSRAEQERRLRLRATDSEDTIERRLAEAETEESRAHRFDSVIVNDDLDAALRRLEAAFGLDDSVG
ncbi:MAG: guanylate kinase [Acidimicrobiia bacterium]|nr:guanylate kinase [Acidimicrobiia bacterium]